MDQKCSVILLDASVQPPMSPAEKSRLMYLRKWYKLIPSFNYV